MVGCCSRNRYSMWKVLFHLVIVSVISLCSGSSNSFCFPVIHGWLTAYCYPVSLQLMGASVLAVIYIDGMRKTFYMYHTGQLHCYGHVLCIVCYNGWAHSTSAVFSNSTMLLPVWLSCNLTCLPCVFTICLKLGFSTTTSEQFKKFSTKMLLK